MNKIPIFNIRVYDGLKLWLALNIVQFTCSNTAPLRGPSDELSAWLLEVVHGEI